MNLEDESHLSAYLDDELDPADRLAVEWSVESSPPRADRLRAIALVRDAVAGLDRPTIPRDLAPLVVAKLASNRQRSHFWAPARLARAASIAAAFTGFAALAASLVVAIVLLNRPLHETPDRIEVAQNDPAPTPRTHPIVPSASASIPASVSAPLLARLSNESESTGPAPELVATTELPADPIPPVELTEREGRRAIGGMLARSHVRRILIVTDVIGAPELARELIAANGRETPEFGRILIRQEIVIDPDHAEAAEVFAVPIDERGRGLLVDRLRAAFPDLLDEGAASPEMVTQLTEVGQVAILQGLKVATLGDPPGDLSALIANRERDRITSVFEADRASLDRPGSAKAGSVGKTSLPTSDLAADLNPSFVGPPDFRRKPAPKPGDRVTLIVWVTHPNRR